MATYLIVKHVAYSRESTNQFYKMVQGLDKAKEVMAELVTELVTEFKEDYGKEIKLKFRAGTDGGAVACGYVDAKFGNFVCAVNAEEDWVDFENLQECNW